MKYEIIEGKKNKKEDLIVLVMLISIIIGAFALMFLCLHKGNVVFSEMTHLMETEAIIPSILDYLGGLSWYLLALLQISVIGKIINQIIIWKTGKGIIKRILSHIYLN